MDSERNNIKQEVNEIFNNILANGNLKLKEFYVEDYSKNIIIFINAYVKNYINIYSYKNSKICRYINFLSKKFMKVSLNDSYKYSRKNGTNIKKILLLIYLMIYRNHISILNDREIK